MTVQQVEGFSHIDPWFRAQIEDIVRQEQALAGCGIEDLDAAALRALKRAGFSDRRLAKLLMVEQDAVRARRHALGVRPVFKRVDTCAAEFATSTAYMYSTYEEECEAKPTGRRENVILGAVRIASARASSSIIAVCMRRSRCGRPDSRPSWSIAIRKRSPPISIPPIDCISSP